MEICLKRKCTGCGMCVNICPRQAISLCEGENGFLFPVINPSLCVQCGLCKEKCPANEVQSTNATYKEIFAAWNKQKKVRANTTSGGIVPLIAEAVLKEQGCVVGVQWEKPDTAAFCLIEDVENLSALYGSKYVQADTGDIYIKVKRALEADRKVLFIGTPCQVNALQNFLGNDDPNLITVDLVCHGVPSKSCLKRYLNEITPEGDGVKKVTFRYKNPYWDYCSVRIEFQSNKPYSALTLDDPYFVNFNSGYTLRESCHNCQYTSLHRRGDITLSDFWNYKVTTLKMRDYLYGISMIMLNTDKGEWLFNRVKSHLVYQEASIEDAKRANHSLTTSQFFCPDDNKQVMFWEDYERGVTMGMLMVKYNPNRAQLPSLLWLRRIKKRFLGVIRK